MNGSPNPAWFKNRGYLHITKKLDLRNKKEIISKVCNPTFVARYNFFPLIHSSIDERKYKKVLSQIGIKKRAHSYRSETGKTKKNVKKRPLHYASHMDAMIFAYYANSLQEKYEEKLRAISGLSDCITAYRRIKIDSKNKNKGTIQFAKEVFDEITRRSNEEEIIVLAYDIKSFFPSLNHDMLKLSWSKLLDESKLPEDHYNVFKASTKFSYILLDDLRVCQRKEGRKSGFDEKKLAYIRNQRGIEAFFESPKDFRDSIKEKRIKIYRYPFWDKELKTPIGIPQGLPISAILANLYLLEFDIAILDKIVKSFGGFYRRYSDDIIIISKLSCSDLVEEIVKNEISKCRLKISDEKTEKFIFKPLNFFGDSTKLTSIRIRQDRYDIGIPLTYLGFEFYGFQTLVKSANVAKFYRRLIFTIKRKSKIAFNLAKNGVISEPVLYYNSINKVFKKRNLSSNEKQFSIKRIVSNEKGEFDLIVKKKIKDCKGNYISYLNRVSVIMDTDKVMKQYRSYKRIFGEAVKKHFISKIR